MNLALFKCFVLQMRLDPSLSLSLVHVNAWHTALARCGPGCGASVEKCKESETELININPLTSLGKSRVHQHHVNTALTPCKH